MIVTTTIGFATTNSNLSTLHTSISTSVSDSGSDILDTSLVDAVENQSQSDLIKELQSSKDSLKLSVAKSCEDFDSIMTKWIAKNKDFFASQGGGYYGRPMPIDGMVLEDKAVLATTPIVSAVAKKDTRTAG